MFLFSWFRVRAHFSTIVLIRQAVFVAGTESPMLPDTNQHATRPFRNVVAQFILCRRHKWKFELFDMLLLYLPFGQKRA